MVPGTVQQLTVLLVLVMPGVFYQAVRERLRGLLPTEQEPQNRLVRAIAAGALLDAVYAVAAGPWLVKLITDSGKSPLAGLSRHPRQTGVAALLLVVVVPSLVAWGEAKLTVRRLRARYDPTPTAWDSLFRDRGSCFVRIRLKSGLWVGGWLGSRSAVSAYPQEADIYMEAQYSMRHDGTFVARVADTGGVYVKAADVEVLEILLPPAAPTPRPPEVTEAVSAINTDTGSNGETSGAAATTTAQ